MQKTLDFFSQFNNIHGETLLLELCCLVGNKDTCKRYFVQLFLFCLNMHQLLCTVIKDTFDVDHGQDMRACRLCVCKGRPLYGWVMVGLCSKEQIYWPDTGSHLSSTNFGFLPDFFWDFFLKSLGYPDFFLRCLGFLPAIF